MKKLIIIFAILMVGVSFSQRKFAKKKVLNEDISQYTLADGHLTPSALDSLGNIVFNNRIKIDGTDYNSLNIDETFIKDFIKTKFSLQDI